MKVTIAGIVLFSLGLVSTARAGQDCALGQRYIDLAHDRERVSEFDEAIDFLQHAIEACPNYEGYQLLGDLQAQSPQREDRAHAVDAFLSAYGLAPTTLEEAHSLYSYARLLNQDGDPQNAYRIIKSAQELDPSNNDITTLAAQIEQQVQNPTKEAIVRGLFWDSLYKPLRLAAVRTSGASGGSSIPTKNNLGSASLNQGPSDTLPINFETGTTIVDEKTQTNIAILARALADPRLAGKSFIFVGHADIRGIESENLVLSKRRAEAICQSVVLLEPGLRGRIQITGRGSAEPLVTGNDEAAYRANRRLQVLLN
jgi:outer membrane protein OmpA-like peptidoglycan-associated protein